MKRASYRDAIQWLAGNDDTSWLDEADGLSIAAGLVADLFGVDAERVRRDATRARSANMRSK